MVNSFLLDKSLKENLVKCEQTTSTPLFLNSLIMMMFTCTYEIEIKSLFKTNLFIIKYI